MVDIVNIPRMLFLGSDKVRLLAPLKCEQEFTMTVTVANVEDKDNGIAVYLSVVWNVIGQEKPVTIDTFIIRYMNACLKDEQSQARHIRQNGRAHVRTPE